MPDAVCRMLTLLCTLVVACPLGTNLGLLHLLWMLASGRLLGARGALFPGLADCGRSAPAARRAWAALGQGNWTSGQFIGRWAGVVAREGQWQPHAHGGYRPVAVDGTGFWRPRLRGCPTTHDHGVAGRALPAIPLGRIAGVGSAGAQRLAVPRAFVRADPADPTPGAHARRLVREAARQCAADEVLVLDAGCGVALLQEEGRPVTSSGWRRMPPSAGRCPRPTAGAAGPPPAGRRCARWRARTRGARSPPPRRIASRRGARTPSCCAPRSGPTWSGPTRPPTAPPSPYSPSTTRATASRCCSPRRSHSRRARLLPQPLAGGATPLGGEADARGRPPVRPRPRDLPAPA